MDFYEWNFKDGLDGDTGFGRLVLRIRTSLFCCYKDVKEGGGLETFSTKGWFHPTKEGNARRAG